MQQTTKYKFNIIDTSDAFGPEALNDNANKLEAALLEHKAETDAALARTDAALAAHKSETDSALSSQQQAWQTAADSLKATDAALSQTITAVEKGASLFHLAGPVDNNTAKQDFTIDLSGVDMSKYRALLLFAITNESSKISCSDAGLSCSPYSSTSYSKLATVIWIYNALSAVKVHCSTSFVSDSTSTPYVRAPRQLDLTKADWEAIDHLDCNAKVLFLDVYGLKV